MRSRSAPWLAIVAATLALLLASVSASPKAQHQLVFTSGHDDESRGRLGTWAASHPPAHTQEDNGHRLINLIDHLSQSSNHTLLVRMLQRSRLIPTLNRMLELDDGSGLTILAPTNEAILRKRDEARQARLAAAEAEAGRAKHIWEWAVDAAVEGAEPLEEAEGDARIAIWTPPAQRRASQSSALTFASLDNVNEALRQQLLYHVLNFTIFLDKPPASALQQQQQPLSVSLGSIAPGSPKMLSTLHFPTSRYIHEPTRPGPVPQPPTAPPHPGGENGAGLLGGEGQKLRFGRPSGSSGSSSSDLFAGTDAKGEGGVKILDQWIEDRVVGTVLSVDGVLELPPDFETLVRNEPRLSHLLELLSPEVLSTLCETAHSTFFLPVSKAFDSLSSIEKTFIMGPWLQSAQERVKLMGWHTSGQGVGEGRVAYADRLRKANDTSVPTVLGGQLHVVATSSDGEILVDKARIVQEDILTENGVVHIVDSLLLPGGDLGMTVEQTLLALNASRFVDLMHATGLEDYINKSPANSEDPDEDERPKPWTFMVPRDDAIDSYLNQHRQKSLRHAASAWGKWSRFESYGFGAAIEDREEEEDGDDDAEGGNPWWDAAKNMSKLAEVLRYHIAPGALLPDKLQDKMLLGTELRDWRLKDQRQRVPVAVGEVASSGSHKPSSEVAFGDANVIAQPVSVGPAVIYLVSQLIEPPLNPIQTAVSSLSLSTFVATVFSAELDKPIKRAPAVTYIVPHNDAFSALGLAMPYLLRGTTDSWQELRSVVEYHAIDDIVYMADFAQGSMRYPTLEGSPIWAGRTSNGSVEVRRGTEGRNAKVVKGDILTSTGVIHEIDQVELPPTLDLTIEKLLKGAKAETMRDLIVRAGYGWVLNGTAPPDEETAAELESNSLLLGNGNSNHGKRGNKKRHQKRHRMLADELQSYVVLVPTDAAFAKVNLTYYLNDEAALKALVQLHIIPSPADQVLPGGTSDLLPLRLEDEGSVTSLLDRELGGESRFGRLAFRRTGRPGKKDDGEDGDGDGPERSGLGWTVGVAGSRFTPGESHAANVLSFGRESLSVERLEEPDQPREGSTLRLRNGATLSASRTGDKGRKDWNSRSVGGVLTLDAVLQPYHPTWFYRWGWIVLTVLIALGGLAGMGYALWAWKRNKGIRLPDALEGEEE